MCLVFICMLFFFFKQKTAYEMRISDWSSDVCSSDLRFLADPGLREQRFFVRWARAPAQRWRYDAIGAIARPVALSGQGVAYARHPARHPPRRQAVGPPYPLAGLSRSRARRRAGGGSVVPDAGRRQSRPRSEEHTSELP